jgi:hypothetical protein
VNKCEKIFNHFKIKSKIKITNSISFTAGGVGGPGGFDLDFLNRSKNPFLCF